MEPYQRTMLRNIILGGIVIVLGIIVYLVLTTPSYKSFSLYKTPFSVSSFSMVKGNALYSYSGLSFYKQAISSGDSVTVLNSGVRLPVIENLYWAGDNGALLTFTDGGYIGSALERELMSRQLEWNNDSKEYLWYLDFKTSKLMLVSEYPLISESVYYSDASESIYYARQNGFIPESDIPNGLPLIAYSTKNLTETTVLENLGTEAVEFIGPCETIDTICFSIQNPDGASLYKVGKDGKQTKVLNDTFDSINPTSSPTIFIGVQYDDVSENEGVGEVLQATVYHIDLATKKTTKTDTKIGSTRSILSNIGEGDSFYLYEPTSQTDKSGLTYVAGSKNLLGTTKTRLQVLGKSAELKQTSSSIVTPISITANGLSLFGDIDGSMFLIAPEKFNYQVVESSSTDVEKNIEPCLKKYTKSYDYTDELKQFKIGIIYDDTFTQRIKSFSTCVDQVYPAAYSGYYFVIVGLSSTDGRFVTD